jgi:hydrogenase-4 membrane subunit HyfE
LILLSSGSKVTLNWFKKEHVTPVTFVCVLANLLSLSIGLFLPGLFISPSSTQSDIIGFLRMEAIIVSVPFLLLAIFIREKP